MEHVLDNPAWNALISGNKNFANGDQDVKYFDQDVSPFTALREISDDNFRTLHQIIPHDNPILFITPVEMELPAEWNVLRLIKALQMVADTANPADVNLKLVRLTDEHVPQMMALTKLTNPGPFAANTIRFGHYHGIFESDRLVAMAGQRLHIYEYAEIRAVCTHPDHVGKGYAKQLLLHQMHRIKAAAGIPFLHVRTDNERAINVYESLGFSARHEMNFYLLEKNRGLQV